LIWSERESPCKVLTKAPAALGCSTSEYPNIEPDDYTIYGRLSLVTADSESKLH
ncbi:hypothetical protein BGZ97_008332, partial [Linnemannia gamsii]